MSSSNVEQEKDVEEQELAAKTLLQTIRIGLMEITKPLEVQQENPNFSLLHPIKSFKELLKPALLEVVNGMGSNWPSEVQAIALPYLVANPPQNVIVQHQSRIQITQAFVLAMLSRVDTSKMYPQILCLSPTYELAKEMEEIATKMSKFYPEIKLKLAIPELEIAKGSKIEEHIVLGTPGKVFDWSSIFKLFDLKKISVLVLYEADVMITTESLWAQCFKILKILPDTCQMMFSSSRDNEKAIEYVEKIVEDPIIIRQLKEEEVLGNIKQYYVKCKDKNEKYQAIKNIDGVINIRQAIIFCNTHDSASWLAEKMSGDGHSVAILSDNIEVEQRINVLNRFREGLIKVLITGNIHAKEILAEPVMIVVNYDMPLDRENREDYLHRIARTARSGQYGIAINLIDPNHATTIYKSIEEHFQQNIHLLNTNNAEEIERSVLEQLQKWIV